MASLDRLGWAAGLVFVTHGVRVGIRVNQPDALASVSACLPPCAVPSPASIVPDLYSLYVAANDRASRVRRYHLLYLGASQLARTMEIADVYRTLAEHLQLLVAIRAPRRLFLRAGVVRMDGKAIIVAGEDQARNDALISALLDRGATCYSRKFAILDTDGRVHAYPAPVAVELESTSQPSPAPPPTKRDVPVPLGCVLFPGAERTTPSRVRQISAAQAMLGLLSHCVVGRLRPEFALRVLRHALSGVVALETPAECQDILLLAEHMNRAPSSTAVCS